jgi:hypothetical protein
VRQPTQFTIPGVVADTLGPGDTRLLEYEPGDGRHYSVAVMPLHRDWEGGRKGEHALVTVFEPVGMRGSYIFFLYDYLATSYVIEKLEWASSKYAEGMVLNAVKAIAIATGSETDAT